MSDMRPSWQRIARAAKEVLFGMALHGFMRFNLRQKGHLENLLVIVTFGDLLGVPIMPPYYALRLVPYFIPQMETWPRRILRERDFTDFLS